MPKGNEGVAGSADGSAVLPPVQPPKGVVAVDFGGTLFGTREITDAEAREIFEAWQKSEDGEVSGKTSNGSCYFFWYSKDTQIADLAAVKDLILNTNGRCSAFIAAETIQKLSACFGILTSNGYICIPATNRLSNAADGHPEGKRTALAVLDLAFGSERSFFTQKQFDDLEKGLKEKLDAKKDGDDEKIVMLQHAQEIFGIAGDKKSRIHFFDDTEKHVTAANLAGYVAEQINKNWGLLNALVSVMREGIHVADLQRSVAAAYPDLKVREWLEKVLGLPRPKTGLYVTTAVTVPIVIGGATAVTMLVNSAASSALAGFTATATSTLTMGAAGTALVSLGILGSAIFTGGLSLIVIGLGLLGRFLWHKFKSAPLPSPVEAKKVPGGTVVTAFHAGVDTSEVFKSLKATKQPFPPQPVVTEQVEDRYEWSAKHPDPTL